MSLLGGSERWQKQNTMLWKSAVTTMNLGTAQVISVKSEGVHSLGQGSE